MIVERLELSNFRNYGQATFELTNGVTAVLGRNGQGKTNLAEALGYLATLSSFRGAPTDALIAVGHDQANIRATVREPNGREILIEAGISRQGRNQVQVNRQRLGRVRELLGVLRVSVFAPDDLIIIKGGPGERRRFLDDTLVALATKYDAMRLDIDRVLQQRNTLLKNARRPVRGPAPQSDDGSEIGFEATLDVWDERLVDLGEPFGHARATLVARLHPFVAEAYEQLGNSAANIELRYEPQWRRVGLAQALRLARDEDRRRGVSTVGPHRDEVEIYLDGLATRTHASQGEQRALALALRLAAHRLTADRTDSTPVLVLDDVLSELDPTRAAALLNNLPTGQIVITSALPLPEAAQLTRTLHIESGTVSDAAYHG